MSSQGLAKERGPAADGATDRETRRVAVAGGSRIPLARSDSSYATASKLLAERQPAEDGGPVRGTLSLCAAGRLVVLGVTAVPEGA